MTSKKPRRVIVCEAPTRDGLHFMEKRLTSMGATPVITRGASRQEGDKEMKRIFRLSLTPAEYQAIFERREA
jgi:hypothetical protein